MSLASRIAGRRWRTWFGLDAQPRRLADMRFAVVDVDLTGVRARRDRVIGIAALPLQGGAFRISDLRYCPVPKEPGASGHSGAEWRSDYAALREVIAGSMLVTYNPAFVRHMISRTCRAADLPPPQSEWIDLEFAADVMGRQDNELTTMKYWLKRMKATGPRPYDATNDVFAMAQLLQAVLAYAEETGIETLESLGRVQSARPWLRRR